MVQVLRLDGSTSPFAPPKPKKPLPVIRLDGSSTPTNKGIEGMVDDKYVIPTIKESVSKGEITSPAITIKGRAGRLVTLSPFISVLPHEPGEYGIDTEEKVVLANNQVLPFVDGFAWFTVTTSSGSSNIVRPPNGEIALSDLRTLGGKPFLSVQGSSVRKLVLPTRTNETSHLQSEFPEGSSVILADSAWLNSRFRWVNAPPFIWTGADWGDGKKTVHSPSLYKGRANNILFHEVIYKTEADGKLFCHLILNKNHVYVKALQASKLI